MVALDYGTGKFAGLTELGTQQARDAPSTACPRGPAECWPDLLIAADLPIRHAGAPIASPGFRRHPRLPRRRALQNRQGGLLGPPMTLRGKALRHAQRSGAEGQLMATSRAWATHRRRPPLTINP